MEANMSYRLSGNGYDTAGEDSISMYYSFNGTAEDKTLENSILDTTVEAENNGENLHTVVKVPQINLISPVAKGKCGRNLLLAEKMSSTPSGSERIGTNEKITNVNLNLDTEPDSSIIISDSERTLDNEQASKANCDTVELNSCEQTDRQTIVQNVTSTTTIVESFSQMRIDRIEETDISVKFIENSEKDDDVLKDVSAKILSPTNNIKNIVESKDKFVKDIITQETESVMAEKLMQDIRTLLQGGVISKKQSNEKENLPTNENDKIASKETGIKKPSRLSTFAGRRSILQTEKQVSTKTITPTTRINSRQSFNGPQMQPRVVRDPQLADSKTLQIESKETKVSTSRRTMLPNSRMSILNPAKTQLHAITENGLSRTPTKKLANKRFSVYGSKSKLASIKNEPRFVPVVKTTLSSPVMARKDTARRSINKFSNAPNPNLAKSRLSSVMPRIKSEQIKAIKPPNDLSKAPPEKPKPVEAEKSASFPRKDYVCEICSRSFRVSSIFEAHKKTHNQSSKVAKDSNTCKFCDKSFAISKALDKHLLENCTKIPLAEKKKIKIADEDSRQVENLTSTSSSVADRNRDRLQHRSSILPPSRKSIASRLMPPPPTTKLVKKSVAHAGVSKTPNKAVRCKPCEKSFDNVLSFAEHVLSHSNSSLDEK